MRKSPTAVAAQKPEMSREMPPIASSIAMTMGYFAVCGVRLAKAMKAIVAPASKP